MPQKNFIVREPLLGPKQQVLGYALNWQQAATEGDAAAAESVALAETVAQHLVDPESGWLLENSVLFLPATAALLASDALQDVPAKNIVLTLEAEALADPQLLESLRESRTRGFGVALRVADVSRFDKSLLSLASHIEVHFNPGDLASQARIYGALKASSVRIIARHIENWQQYDASAALGLDAFVGKLHLTPRPGAVSKGLNPSQGVVLQLMNMVRRNADARELESMLRRDAALSFKLLRYINSAGFGRGTEISSLRHAVTMLGYTPLFRWLSLLLATASTTGYSPVLMQTAVIRGRFTELLGASQQAPGGAENLFVAGLFSLLDRLLGVPMEQVLQKMQLSDELAQAMLTRQGIYGDYLALAEACELDSALVGAMAAALHLDADTVNQHHLAAVAWSHNLQL